jgi:hypothetical protein
MTFSLSTDIPDPRTAYVPQHRARRRDRRGRGRINHGMRGISARVPAGYPEAWTANAPVADGMSPGARQ